MSKSEYQQKLKEYQKSKENFEKAEKRLQKAKEKLQDIRQDIPKKYEEMTETLAAYQAEEEGVTQKDAKQSETAYREAEQELEEAKKEVAIAEKVRPKRAEQKLEALRALKGPAQEYFKDKAQPLLSELLDFLADYEKLNGRMNELRKEINKAGLSPGSFLPPEITKYKLNHLKKQFSADGLRKKIERDFITE